MLDLLCILFLNARFSRALSVFEHTSPVQPPWVTHNVQKSKKGHELQEWPPAKNKETNVLTVQFIPLPILRFNISQLTNIEPPDFGLQ